MIIRLTLAYISGTVRMNRRELTYKAVFDGKIEDNLREYGYSSQLIVRLKSRMGLVTVNDVPQPLIANVKEGDVIKVILEDEPSPRPKYNHSINIVYEDEDIAVIDKTPDVAVIETMPHYGRSLANILAGVWGDFVYRPINRLDRQTSGLMAVAKNGYVHSMFSTKRSDMVREYLAVVHGIIDEEGVIEAPIAKCNDGSVRREVRADGQYARTVYKRVEVYGDRSLVRFRLDTGRTHQIRVHSSYIGHSLMGDDMYGGSLSEISRHALHSCYMEFIHPITGEKKVFESDIPDDMKRLIKLHND